MLDWRTGLAGPQLLKGEPNSNGQHKQDGPGAIQGLCFWSRWCMNSAGSKWLQYGE